MTRQCAWCGCFLEPPPAVVGRVITHGICLACAEEMLAGIADDHQPEPAHAECCAVPTPLTGGAHP